MPIPRLVLSYVRSERDSFLDRFYQDLRKEIALREGLDNSDDNSEPGFRDTDSISGGSNFREELAKALAESWTCVCVYTPNYFKREACGKEFQIFLDRSMVKYAPDGTVTGAKGILPVLWVSMEDLKRNGLPPKIAAGINFRARKHHVRYEKDGLRQILRRSPRTTYVDILDDIVSDLIVRFKDRPAPLSEPPEYATVKNAFEQHSVDYSPGVPETSPAGPRNVQVFLIENSQPGQQSLADETENSWREILASSCAEIQLIVDVLSPSMQDSEELLNRIADLACRNVVVVVMVASSAAATDGATIQGLLNSLTTSDSYIGAILLPSPDGVSQLEAKIPTANVDRIFLKATREDPAAIVAGIKDLAMQVICRIVKDAEVHQHPPGGATSSERPKIQGTAKEGNS